MQMGGISTSPPPYLLCLRSSLAHTLTSLPNKEFWVCGKNLKAKTHFKKSKFCFIIIVTTLCAEVASDGSESGQYLRRSDRQYFEMAPGWLLLWWTWPFIIPSPGEWQGPAINRIWKRWRGYFFIWLRSPHIWLCKTEIIRGGSELIRWVL